MMQSGTSRNVGARSGHRAAAWVQLHLLLATLWLALVVGCNVSPQPDPPSASVNPDGVSITPTTEEEVTVRGAEGAARPPGASIRVLNLSGAVIGESVVGEDGSFAVGLMGMAMDRFRLTVHDGSDRSRPVDVTGEDPGGGIVMPLEQPLECLSVEPGLELDLGDVAVGDIGLGMISMHNECDMEVVIGFVRPIFGSPDFDVRTGDLPVFVPIASSRNAVVTYQPLTPGESFEVLQIEATAIEPALIDVSVFGRAFSD